MVKGGQGSEVKAEGDEAEGAVGRLYDPRSPRRMWLNLGLLLVHNAFKRLFHNL